MIPQLYDPHHNISLGRLPDCISCIVTEERNGIYECDFTYPVTGKNFDNIKLGHKIEVTHDDTGDVQGFDIVSYSKPIDGVVAFHAVHTSYRLTKMVAIASNITSFNEAVGALNTAANPDFYFGTLITASGYAAAFDGTPKTIRQLIGGEEGSVLDTYGSEIEWDGNMVRFLASRGKDTSFTIRYGVNMTNYTDETDCSGSFTSCVPYWNGSDGLVIGSRVDSGLPSYSGRTGGQDCVPLDLTERFETKPSAVDLENEALAYMRSRHSNMPSQNITVNFVRLQDMGYEDLGLLLSCNLCDTVNVMFPAYNMSGRYKIVKVVYNVLLDRYDEMELGALKTTLAEALGVGQGSTTTISGGGGGGYSTATRTAIDFHTLNKTYTPTESGVLVMIGRASAANASISVYDTTINEYAGILTISNANAYGTLTTFLLNGHTYKINGVANWTSNGEAFYGFGGLVDGDSLNW